MPLYEYACSDCSHRFEILQRIGEDADGLECPECESAELEKQFSTFASSSDGASASVPATGCGAGSGFT